MKALVIGAGKMGSTVAWDLKKQDDVEVTVADKSEENLGVLSGVRLKTLDLGEILSGALGGHPSSGAVEFLKYLEEFDVVVNCSDYKYNSALSKCAVLTKTNMCDLGGNVHIVKEQLKIHHSAQEAGITIIPDCGLAPGFAGLLATLGVHRFTDAGKKVCSVKIRVGGLPAHPKPPLNYKMVFSARGLLNEYIEPCEIVASRQHKIVEPLEGLEAIIFPEPYGQLEAFNTSGGSSTLTRTLVDKVRFLNYKTIRYPGHCNIFKAFKQLGMFEGPERERLEESLNRNLTDNDEDVVLVRVSITEDKNYLADQLTFQVIDKHNPYTDHSAMARMTAYPTAIIAHMLGTGRISQKGVLPGEMCVPIDELVDKMRDRGINITETTQPVA